MTMATPARSAVTAGRFAAGLHELRPYSGYEGHIKARQSALYGDSIMGPV